MVSCYTVYVVFSVRVRDIPPVDKNLSFNVPRKGEETRLDKLSYLSIIE